MSPSVSCLVISRTPALLNRMLASLAPARLHWNEGDEVLCSWNGSEADEAAIEPPEGPAFRIAQREPYHFASNMNALADAARGDLLVLINDDVVLDRGSLDRAIHLLGTHPEIALVGGRLRGEDGRLTHAGLLLSQQGLPYNRLRPDQLPGLIEADGLDALESGPIPAVTGALMVLPREVFLAVRFRETFRVCGEDIALCLQIPRQLGRCVYYASDVSGIHEEKSTRGATVDHFDVHRLADEIAARGGLPALEGTNLAHWAIQEGRLFFETIQRLRGELRDLENEKREAVIRLEGELKAADLAHRDRQRALQLRLNDAELRASLALRDLEAIQESRTWKATAPLRSLADRVRPPAPEAAGEEAAAAEPLTALPSVRRGAPPAAADEAAAEPGLHHVVFDSLILGLANRASVSRGGIYRYASQLMIALVQGGHVEQLHPYCPDPLLGGSVREELEAMEAATGLRLATLPGGSRTPRLPDPGSRLKRLIKPLYRRLLRSGQLQAMARRNLESTLARCTTANTVFHTPFQSVPPEVRRSGIRSVVVTVHDMLPRIHPEFFTEETIRHFSEMIDQLDPDDHVVCVSESTRRDFLRFNRVVPDDHVHVTPLAASPDLRPVRDGARLQAYRHDLGLAEGERIVLSLCTLEPRKNLTTLIDAFEALRRGPAGGGVRLVLAGSMGWKTSALTERIRDSEASDAISVTGHVPDADLATLLSCADVFVYPSLYEGFGLPPLEAMQCGTPVIVGNSSSLPEVVGEAALLVDPRSAGELRQAMERLLGSCELRGSLSEAALAQAHRFSWQRTAARTAEIYGRTLAG